MLQTRSNADGSLVMTVPKAFVDQNQLQDGSQVELSVRGKTMMIKVPGRPRYQLSELLAEMPNGLPRVEGWDEMPAIGLERG